MIADNTQMHVDPASPSVLVVGDARHPDFAQSLTMMRATIHVDQISDVQRACRMLAGGQPSGADEPSPSPPQWIVFAQSRPGLFSDNDAEALREAAPTATQIALLGSWCEGETRTGKPLSDVQRVFWYAFEPWWRRELRGLSASATKPQAAATRQPGRAGLIVVGTSIRDTATALMEGLREEGFSTLWVYSGGQPASFAGACCGVWVGGQLEPQEEPDLAAFCQRMRRDGAPVAALLDFPRRSRCELAVRLGAAAVLPQPWSHDDLFSTIDHLHATKAADANAAAQGKAA